MGYGKLVMHGLGMLMPLVDRIAVRALVVFAVTFFLAGALAITVVAVKLFTDAAIPGWATYTLLGALILSLVSLGNFVTLFMIFSQTRASWLANIEQSEKSSSVASQTADDGSTDIVRHRGSDVYGLRSVAVRCASGNPNEFAVDRCWSLSYGTFAQ